MGYFRFAALGVLAMGMASFAAIPENVTIKSGVAFQGSELDNNNYRPGVGVNGSVTSEKSFHDAAGAGGLGIRANYSHYNIEGDELFGRDLDEGGVALTGLIGPNSAFFQPRIGGHMGYQRVEDNNYFDWGPDITADLKITPEFGMQAQVIPSWYVNDNGSDYFGTKVGLGVLWAVPGV